MTEGTDAGLPPVTPCGLTVEFDVATLFTTGGAVSASAGVADVDDRVG